LALIGFRGSGKTTVGRLLAREADRMFLDADREIEARAGRSIRTMFAEWGEPVFRDWEERTLAEITAAYPTAVVATGGGVVLREVNRRTIRSFGFVVWLTASPSELARRLELDPSGLAERPPLTSAGTLEEIGLVLAARAGMYEGLADLVIDTGELSPDQVVCTILNGWRPGSGI
jgi:shikimate kinase